MYGGYVRVTSVLNIENSMPYFLVSAEGCEMSNDRELREHPPESSLPLGSVTRYFAPACSLLKIGTCHYYRV